MTDHKFTDEEIIKCLIHCNGGDCETCKALGVCDATWKFHQDALALINRQKAEIESLQAVHADMTESLRLAAEANKDMQAEIERLRKYNTDVAFKHYNDAIKEYAERLKAELTTGAGTMRISVLTIIDDLVKEMIARRGGRK